MRVDVSHGSEIALQKIISGDTRGAEFVCDFSECIYGSSAYYTATLSIAMGLLPVASFKPLITAQISLGHRIVELTCPRRLSGRDLKLGVVWTESDQGASSNARTIDLLSSLAKRKNISVSLVSPKNLTEPPNVDALFLRTIGMFEVAWLAEACGMPIIDRAEDTFKCNDKAFQITLFKKHGIPSPFTEIVTALTPQSDYGLSRGCGPWVVKRPDLSFGDGVWLCQTYTELRAKVEDQLCNSPLLLVQEFVPSDYDWRIVILDQIALFVCRYGHISRGWKVAERDSIGKRVFGACELVSREAWPADVVNLAVTASRLIGNGLYGVDIKSTPAGPIVMEVNDNPDIYLGNEEREDGSSAWIPILNWFRRRCPTV